MRPFIVVAAVTILLSLSSMPIASGQTTLPPVKVTANPCDYGISCTFASGGSAFLVPMSHAFPPANDSIGRQEDLVATCKSLRDRARKIGCNVNNPPPAPSFPSPTQGSWQANGCGDGSWKSQIGQFILGVGNLDEPMPGFSFRPACDFHDQCYHIGFKSFCDLKFGNKLADICATSKTCGDIAAKYEDAVHHFGQSAYDNDQKVMECAKISKDLRDGNCAS